MKYQYDNEKEVIEAAKKFLCKESSSCQFTDPQLAKDFLLLNHEQTDHERFSVMFMDCKHKLLKHEVIAEGTLNRAEVYIRTLAQKALKVNAGAVILCHNHPSGDTAPSEADIRLTKHITKALDIFDIRVLDHIIVGNDTTSLAERSLM